MAREVVIKVAYEVRDENGEPECEMQWCSDDDFVCVEGLVGVDDINRMRLLATHAEQLKREAVQ